MLEILYCEFKEKNKLLNIRFHWTFGFSGKKETVTSLVKISKEIPWCRDSRDFILKKSRQFLEIPGYQLKFQLANLKKLIFSTEGLGLQLINFLGKLITVWHIFNDSFFCVVDSVSVTLKYSLFIVFTKIFFTV